MKKYIVFLLVLTMAIGLAACQKPVQKTQEAVTETTAVAPTTVPTKASTVTPTEAPTAAPTAVPTAVPTTAPAETSTEAPTAEPTEEPTEDPHSEFYVEGVSQDQMVEYFNEVVLSMEYTTGDGNAALVQKWDRTISYRIIDGVPTKQDAQIISDLCKALNEVEGFPGIRAATGLEQNLAIYFLHDDEFETQFSHLVNGEYADGAVQFWYYNATNNIYNGRIGYRKDNAQEIRNSVIPEEIINLLGISDTTLREDSITYQYGDEATEPSAVDWAIIKLLYNPKIECGMDAAQCEAVIRELYY